MRFSSLSTFYGRALVRVAASPLRAAAFLFSLLLHALGHALLAVAAGATARALVVALPRIGAFPSEVDATFGTGGGHGALHIACMGALVGLVAATVKGAAGAAATYLQARVSGEVGSQLRLQLLAGWHHEGPRAFPPDDGGKAHAMAHPMAPAAVLGVLTESVREVEGGLRVGVLGGVRAVAQLGALAAALVWLSPRLALLALAFLAPFALILGGVRRRVARGQRSALRDGEALLAAADEAVRHADLWTTYGAQDRVRAHVASLGSRAALQSARREAGASAWSASNEILGALALVLTLVAARAGLLPGGATVDGATALAFVTTFFMAYRPLRDGAEARLAFGRARGAFQRLAPLLGDDLSLPPSAIDVMGSPSLLPLPEGADPGLHDLEVESLRIRHGPRAGISFRAPAGSLVCVTGPTGVGKTSLLRALLGLEEPLSGRVRYAGQDLTREPVTSRRRPFAWVPQDAPILAGSLEDNVGLAAPAAAVGPALARLGAAPLARRLAGHPLGAGGRALSGGERQWVCLARALATSRPVLLLDEPTTGLDADARRQVLDALASLRGQHTILVVSHAPEVMAMADGRVHLDGPEVSARMENGQGGPHRQSDAMPSEGVPIENEGSSALVLEG